MNQSIEDQLKQLIVDADAARGRVKARAMSTNAHLSRQAAQEMDTACVALERALRAHRDLLKHEAIARGR